MPEKMEHGTPHPPGSNAHQEMVDLTNGMQDAIPRGTPVGYVTGAMGCLLVSAFKHSVPSDRRMAAFDEWVAFHRAMLTGSLS